jgi:hypothetical protein
MCCYSRKFFSAPSSKHILTKVLLITKFKNYNNAISTQINTVTSQKYRRNIAEAMVLKRFWYVLYRRMRGWNAGALTHRYLINKT